MFRGLVRHRRNLGHRCRRRRRSDRLFIWWGTNHNVHSTMITVKFNISLLKPVKKVHLFLPKPKSYKNYTFSHLLGFSLLDLPCSIFRAGVFKSWFLIHETAPLGHFRFQGWPLVISMFSGLLKSINIIQHWVIWFDYIVLENRLKYIICCNI